MDNIPIGDEEAIEVLLHREIHFGGKFSVMIPYYIRGGRGAMAHIDLKKIEDLATLEIELKENLAPLLLSAADAEKVAASRKMYEELKESYNSERPGLQQLITDLILTEEIDPEGERNAIIAQGKKLVGPLLELLRSPQMHDPLYPGYGYVPKEAALCLSAIGDKRATFTLFEEIGQGDFFDDEVIIKCFKAMGEEGKQFLLKVISSTPPAEDNERAAIALICFKDDPEVQKTLLTLLENEKIQKSFPLNSYIAILFDQAKDPSIQQQFKSIAEKAPKDLQKEMTQITKEWL